MTYKHTNLPYTDWNGEKQEEAVVEVEDEEGKKKNHPAKQRNQLKLDERKKKKASSTKVKLCINLDAQLSHIPILKYKTYDTYLVNWLDVILILFYFGALFCLVVNHLMNSCWWICSLSLSCITPHTTG